MFQRKKHHSGNISHDPTQAQSTQALTHARPAQEPAPTHAHSPTHAPTPSHIPAPSHTCSPNHVLVLLMSLRLLMSLLMHIPLLMALPLLLSLSLLIPLPLLMSLPLHMQNQVVGHQNFISVQQQCDAPKPGGSLIARQPAENLYISYHETHASKNGLLGP